VGLKSGEASRQDSKTLHGDLPHPFSGPGALSAVLLLFVSQFVRPSVRSFVAKIKKPSSRCRILPKFFLGTPGTVVTIVTHKNLNPNGYVMAKGLLDLNAHHAAKSKTHLPTAGFGQIFFGGGTWHCGHNCVLKKNLTPIVHLRQS